MLGWRKPNQSSASKSGKSKEHKLSLPQTKPVFEIFDQSGELLSQCEAYSFKSAMAYARKRYGSGVVVHSLRPKG